MELMPVVNVDSPERGDSPRSRSAIAPEMGRLECVRARRIARRIITSLLDSTQNARLVCLGQFTDHHSSNGAVAQLGERMTGSHEVRGSIPLGSTNLFNKLQVFFEE
jgi:hypothetical protein